MKLEDTIEVIGKLTKSEKRSISITLTRMSKSEEPTEQHYRLYNLLSSIVKDSEKPKNFEGEGQEKIDSQKKYVDDRISKVKEEKPKLFTSLNVIRLYDFIFSTLRSLNADRPTFKLSNYLQDIQILRDKGLSGQALHLIARAKKEAREEGSASGALEYLHFLLLERKIHLTITEHRDFEILENLSRESRNQYDKMEHIVDVTHDQELIHRYVYAGEKIPEEIIDKASSTFKLILEKPEAAKDLPLEVALAELFCTALYLRSIEAPNERVLPQFNQMIALFDEDKISSHSALYHNAKMALINDGLKNGLGKLIHENIHYIIEALGLKPEIPIENQIDKILIDKHTLRDYFNHVFILITYTIGNKKFDVASNIINRIKNLIEEYQPPQGHRIALYWEFASVYFLLRDFDSTREYIDKILDLKSNGGRKDVILEAELLDALLEYEVNMGKEKNSSIHEKVLSSLDTLTKIKKSKQERLYSQNKIESASALLGKLLEVPGSGEKFTKAQLQDLHKIQTKGMGDFITDVFALWTQQKIQSLS